MRSDARDVAHLALDRLAALASGAQREGDVVEGGQVRIEGEELEDEGDVALARLSGPAPACRR